MNEYQKSVADHMATAPVELREYVCARMTNDSWWYIMGGNPISNCGFEWRESKEGFEFWSQISLEKWQDAIATDFWLSRQQPKPEEYDFVNPDHYKQFSYEAIEMMEAIWGKEATALHCEMCAFKYRIRMGVKPDQPIELDMRKVNWYMAKAKELRG